MKASVFISSVVGVVALGTAAGSFYVFMDDRYFRITAAQAQEERVLLVQAQTAISLQVVAKESRLRDIERELRDIEQRKRSAQGPWPGDTARYATLLDDRRILIQRLEQLK
jgi:hypothetical protein